MLTYNLENRNGKPVYIYLYERIKEDIHTGSIKPGEKLPSKRSLASHLGVAIITIENAYSLLEVEGYIYSVEKRGYFVSEEIEGAIKKDSLKETATPISKVMRGDKEYLVDFTQSYSGVDGFPFSVWAKLSRRILSDNENCFLTAPEGKGVYELRLAISDYLKSEKGMDINPDEIIVGPGTEYLHHILIQLLGRNIFVAVEDPGYKKVGKIYQSNGVKLIYVPVDEKGMEIGRLYDSNVKLVHTSPSHHFPTGSVMPIDRRLKLLAWAREQNAYVIEDDYDSEFRFDGRPISTLFSMDSEQVIYMNTFSKSLASSIRIAYMVLPKELMKKYDEKLYFYSGTVSSFDQYTLAAFISEGYYGRHIRRVRNRFRQYRENLLEAIEESGLKKYVIVREDRAGFHMIIEVKTKIKAENFINLLEKKCIKIAPLDIYSYNSGKKYSNKYLICYGATKKDVLIEALTYMENILEKEN